MLKCPRCETEYDQGEIWEDYPEGPGVNWAMYQCDECGKYWQQENPWYDMEPVYDRDFDDTHILD